MPIEVGGDCGAIAMKTSPATIALLALAIPAQFDFGRSAAAQDRPIRLAQAADTTTPSVTPVTPNSSSATCL